jgi:hypothetical protein
VIVNNEKTSQELTQFKQQVEEKIESKDRQFETFQETNKVDINKLKDELKNETINVSTKLDPNKLINLNDLQPPKDFIPKAVTDSGILIDVKPVQSLNIPSTIF